MKKIDFQKSREENTGGQIALRGGAYSLAISAVVLAILIAVNMFASALPTTLTKYDISASKRYSITSNSLVFSAKSLRKYTKSSLPPTTRSEWQHKE